MKSLFMKFATVNLKNNFLFNLFIHRHTHTGTYPKSKIVVGEINGVE